MHASFGGKSNGKNPRKGKGDTIEEANQIFRVTHNSPQADVPIKKVNYTTIYNNYIPSRKDNFDYNYVQLVKIAKTFDEWLDFEKWIKEAEANGEEVPLEESSDNEEAVESGDNSIDYDEPTESGDIHNLNESDESTSDGYDFNYNDNYEDYYDDDKHIDNYEDNYDEDNYIDNYEDNYNLHLH